LQIKWYVRQDPSGADGREVGGAIPGADPQLGGSAVRRLKEENGIVLVAIGALAVWDLTTGQFGHLSYNSSIEAVLRSSFGHISQNFDLT
jgi:hypothetical protein